MNRIAHLLADWPTETPTSLPPLCAGKSAWTETIVHADSCYGAETKDSALVSMAEVRLEHAHGDGTTQLVISEGGSFEFDGTRLYILRPTALHALVEALITLIANPVAAKLLAAIEVKEEKPAAPATPADNDDDQEDEDDGDDWKRTGVGLR